MENPVLVEVTRGPEVESRHRGAVAVIDAEGAAVLTLGDVESRTYPRSAVKALQALPLVESGIADRFRHILRCNVFQNIAKRTCLNPRFH